MIARAVEQNQQAGIWAITVAPDAVGRLQAEVTRVETALAEAGALADQANFDVYLAGINALIALGFTLAGVYAAGAAVPMLFAGSIAVGGVMLVAEAMLSPSTPNGLQIAQDVGLNRIGGILDVAGDDAYALSKNSAQFSQLAGRVVGIVSLSMAAFKAGWTLGAAAVRSQDELRLRDQLAGFRTDLQRLQDVSIAAEFRQACTSAVADDLTNAQTQQLPQCSLP